MKAWQVDVTNVMPTSSATMTWRSGGQLRVTVIVKSVFAFAPNETMPLIDAEPILDADLYDEENPARSVREPSDRYPFRPRVDVVFWGHAYAPGGAPAKRIPARIAIAEGNEKTLDKVIDVVGDRQTPNADPSPFTKMPINYERSYGGAGFEANPIGVGHGPRVLSQPNIVYPQGWHRETSPASFGPIAAAWPGRLRLAGTSKLDFLGKTVTELSPHVDVANFQCAPEDQRIAHLHGGEWILLENLHPIHARLMMRLPDVQGAAMVFGVDGVDTPIAMRPDMLLIDGDREICILTCRGSHPIPNEAALDSLRIAAGVELNRKPIDWTETKQKLTSHAKGAPGTALLDSHTPIQFKAPYAIAEPRKAAALAATHAAVLAPAGAAAPLPSALFAPMAPGSIPAPIPGAATLVAPAAQSPGQLPSLPFPHAALSPPPAIPGAPFASAGSPAAAVAAVPSPVGNSTIALSGPPNIPPNFNELRGQAAKGSSSPAAFKATVPAAMKATGSPNDPVAGQTRDNTPSAAHHAKGTPPTSDLGPGTDALRFASAGSPAAAAAAAAAAVPSPVGNSTIALSGPPNVPPNFNELRSHMARGSSSPAAFNAKVSPNDPLVGPTGGVTPSAAHYAKGTPSTSDLGPGANAQQIVAPYDMSQRPLEKETFVPPDRQYAPYVAMGPPDAQNPVHPMGDSSSAPSFPHDPGAKTRNPASSADLGASDPFSPSSAVGPDALLPQQRTAFGKPAVSGNSAPGSTMGAPGTGSTQQSTAFGKPGVSGNSALGSALGAPGTGLSRQGTAFGTSAVSDDSALGSALDAAGTGSTEQLAAFGTSAVSDDSAFGSALGAAGTGSTEQLAAFGTSAVSDDSAFGSALDAAGTGSTEQLAAFGTSAVSDDSALGSALDAAGSGSTEQLAVCAKPGVSGDSDLGSAEQLVACAKPGVSGDSALDSTLLINDEKEWSWATTDTADLSSQQMSASQSRPHARPAEPPPRAVIYSGFARRK